MMVWKWTSFVLAAYAAGATAIIGWLLISIKECPSQRERQTTPAMRRLDLPATRDETAAARGNASDGVGVWVTQGTPDAGTVDPVGPDALVPDVREASEAASVPHVFFEEAVALSAAESRQQSDALQERARAILSESAHRIADVEHLRSMPSDELSDEDVWYLGSLVDQQANARLARLTEKYGLTDNQQDRVFRILAEASPAYHPVLDRAVSPEVGTPAPLDAGLEPGEAAFSGAPGSGERETVDESLHAVLEPEQQTEYEDEWVNRDLWWTEIIGELSDDLDAEPSSGVEVATDDAATATAPSDETGAEPEDHLGGNLFER